MTNVVLEWFKRQIFSKHPCNVSCDSPSWDWRDQRLSGISGVGSSSWWTNNVSGLGSAATPNPIQLGDSNGR